MARPKRLEMTALMGLVLQAVFCLTCVVLAAKSGSRALSAQAWYVGVGLFVWFVVLAHGRQRRLAEQEREERERLRATRLSDEIFEETELDSARASAGLLFFEKWLVPLFSVILSVLLIFLAYHIADTTWSEEEWVVKMPHAVAVGMVFMSFFGFLIGKYSAGLATNRGFRLLRAAGGYVLGNVITAVLIVVAMAMYYFDILWGETILVYAIPIVMALVGLEVLLNLVLDIYRPRVEGQEARPPYDSRLLGLFAEPEGVLRTLAATLDYQFGFKVSETWFYHFMERAIIPLLLVQIASLWLLSMIVVVDPDEIVFVETFGQPYLSASDAAKGLRATVLRAGLHGKAPWPFAIARHVPAFTVHKLSVGKILHEDASWEDEAGLEDPDVILWRESHIDRRKGFEASFLVPSTAELEEATEPVESEEPSADEGAGEYEVAEAAAEAPNVNLARLAAHVYYRVKRKPNGDIDENAAFTYEYRQSDTQRHVAQLAYRAICRIAASQDFLGWIAEERTEVVQKFGKLVREAIEEADLGLEVVDVAIPSVHPPAEVARAYEGVVAALEGRESLIHEGKQDSIRTQNEAEAHSEELITRARGYQYTQETIATAEAEQFVTQFDAYKRAPRVYMFRTYFDILEESLPGHKVFVVPVEDHEVQVVKLEEKMSTGLLEGLGVLEE
jgi:regulator of protease activity HflC (stomatin/prohibitin superfamily)